MSQSTAAPLLIIGLDAGDPDWLISWAQAGDLPALSALMQGGAWGRTGGVEMVSEHGLWHSLFSGTPRGEHGCYYFRQMRPGTYDLMPFLGRDVNATPFWATVPEKVKVAVVDAPDIPLSPDVNGWQVANWAVHRGWVSSDPHHNLATEPVEFLSEIEKQRGKSEEIIEDSESTLEDDREFLHRLLKRVERKGELCRMVLQKLLSSSEATQQQPLGVFVFGEPHTAGHQFWKYRPDAPPSERKTQGVDLRDATKQIYQAVDREIAMLMECVPPSTNICVVSSLGLEPHYPYGEITTAACKALGYQAQPAVDSKKRLSWKPLDVARRVLPESWRIAASTFLSRDAREKLFAEQFQRDTDWSRTRAFSIPSFFTGFIRINLQGREPQGTVSPQEYETVLDDIAHDFEQLRDGDTGEALVRRVWRANEVFGQQPPSDQVSAMPDLLIDYNPSTSPRTHVQHPRLAEPLQFKTSSWQRDSDHSQQGFWLLSGPDVMLHGDAGTCDVLDFAPTFMHLLGAERTAAMRGKVLSHLLHSQSIEGEKDLVKLTR